MTEDSIMISICKFKIIKFWRNTMMHPKFKYIGIAHQDTEMLRKNYVILASEQLKESVVSHENVQP